MKIPRTTVWFHLAALLAATLANPAAPARAESASVDASAWDRAAHSGMRLVSGLGVETSSAVKRAGLELALDTGWKTYWRYPGDAGVPPRFDFSASDNVASVEVRYPAPQRFEDGNGTSIGYRKGVVLPLAVTPRDPRQPVLLRVKVEYAICEKLCVPVEAKAALSLAPASPETQALLSAHEARVPKRSALGDAAPFAIVAVQQRAGGKERIVVDVRAAAGTTVDLFAEGPTADWSLPVPEPESDAPAGLKRFSFELDGLPSGETGKGSVIVLTAISGDTAIEVPVTLK